MEGKFPQDGASILNTYVSNTRVPVFVKRKPLQLKSRIDPHTLLVEVFNIILSQVDRSCRRKLNRDMLEPTDVINFMNLIDIYRALHPNTKYIFSALRGTVFKIYYILNHKASLNRYRSNPLHPLRPQGIKPRYP